MKITDEVTYHNAWLKKGEGNTLIAYIGSAKRTFYVNELSANFEDTIGDVSLKNQEVTHKKIETYKAIGRGIYDIEGNYFQIKGVNFGNFLIQEGWMSVNSLGPKLNKDGSYVKINEQGIVEEYEEVYQEELDEALLNNPNLTKEQVDELWDIYYKSYCQEEDFKNIKDIGFNTIRLPMYYRNFMEGEDDNLVMKENAFDIIDWFLENAKKYDLMVILDMHGVVGGQSGYEHSGTRDCDFWDNEIYQEEMCDLWKNIASHYMNERNDLFLVSEK